MLQASGSKNVSQYKEEIDNSLTQSIKYINATAEVFKKCIHEDKEFKNAKKALHDFLITMKNARNLEQTDDKDYITRVLYEFMFYNNRLYMTIFCQ